MLFFPFSSELFASKINPLLTLGHQMSSLSRCHSRISFDNDHLSSDLKCLAALGTAPLEYLDNTKSLTFWKQNRLLIQITLILKMVSEGKAPVMQLKLTLVPWLSPLGNEQRTSDSFYLCGSILSGNPWEVMVNK